MAQHRRYGEGQMYQKTPYAFKKPSPDDGNGMQTGGRSEDAMRQDHIANEYTDTHIWRGPDGSWFQYHFKKGKEAFELQHASGTGIKTLDDGSLDKIVTGNERAYTKGSATSTIHGNSDNKVEGTQRTNIKGGSHSEIGGDQTQFVGGASSTLATQGMQIHSRKSTKISGEQGVGFGVGKNTTQHSQMRMFEDGSIRIQVQPSGGSGGVATVFIDAAGEITITTDRSMNVKAEQNINFKCQTFDVKADSIDFKGDMTLKGSLNQDGVHTDSKGTHKACCE